MLELYTIMNTRKEALSYACVILCVSIAALLLRLSAYTVLHFPWPPGTDHFIYYEMAYNSSQGKGPVLDFIYSYLATPAQITHLEDYYEPLYGALCGLLMGKPTYAGSLRLSFLTNLGQLLAIFIFTFFLARRTFQQTVHTAAQSALLALSLLAIHPLFIQRSASLMKESVIGFVYLLFALGVLFLWDRKGSGFILGVSCVGIGLLQYESLPILFTSVFLTLALQKKWFNLSLFTVTFGALTGTYTYWFYHQTGLWMSTKFYFLTSSYDGSSFNKPRPFSTLVFAAKIERAFAYIMRRSIYILGVFPITPSKSAFLHTKPYLLL